MCLNGLYVCGGRDPSCTALWVKWQSVIRRMGGGRGRIQREEMSREKTGGASWAKDRTKSLLKDLCVCV